MDKKRERFIRVATRRTNVVLKRIAVLSNCANRSAYEYTEDEVNRIFNEIERELRTAKTRFQLGKNDRKGEFKL